MKLRSVLMGLIIVSTSNWATGQQASTSTQVPPVRKLVIQPTSTPVMGGKASLTISTLHRKAATFIGEYDLKVSPWSFKNETGKLTMQVSDEALKKLSMGIAVDFTGSVITHGESAVRPVIAKATPSGKEQGSVTFSFTGEDRKVVFNSKYQLRKE
ncbi:MAG: hypothetical protein EOP84_09725 [Verrucomicrobiaceae bacterium]|nr:MAG: hypothetical protein EOP84_09725 [Verrucomicrobiaceae bacterium]